MNSLTLCKTTCIVAIIINCDRLAFPKIDPKEIRTEAETKSAINKLKTKIYNKINFN